MKMFAAKSSAKEWFLFKVTVIGMFIAVIAVAYACMAGCTDSLLRRLQAGQPLRIGYAVEPPYAFLTSDGDVTGESPEIAKRIATRLGFLNIKWYHVEFGSLISKLESGHIDVIAAGMYVTPERERQIAFSETTFQVRSGLLVAAGNPKRLHGTRQVAEEADVRLAVLSGSVEESLYRRLGVPVNRLVVVPDALTGRSAVESGLADALALSSPSVFWMAKSGHRGRVEAAYPYEPMADEKLGCGAFAFRKEDRALRRAWNRALREFLRSDEHAALVASFGFALTDLPPLVVEKGGCRP